jgi:hypothetical protein
MPQKCMHMIIILIEYIPLQIYQLKFQEYEFTCFSLLKLS